MALTAKFVADFTSFQDAVRKAELSLKSFEGIANEVGSSLNRMLDTWSGRKLIQDATLMAQSVERVGGASKLTESELRRVAAATGEAAETMRRMGIEVP